MSFEKFSMDEMEVKLRIPGPRNSFVEVFNTPITPRENIMRMYAGKTPMWIPTAQEMCQFKIAIDPENQARSPKGGIDGYGVEWVWGELAGGAMVRPGAPKCPDINEWEKYVHIPDPDSWDWAGFYETQKDKINPDLCVYIMLGSCLFERLIAIMDCGNACVALIDEDQQEGVHRFFKAVTKYRKRYHELVKQWFNADIVNFNDDWGTQNGPFFSYQPAEEMLVPYVTESCAHAHSIGLLVDLHCCGNVMPLVPLLIQEGMDSWGGQPLNDKPALKRKFADKKFLFTHELPVKPDASEDDINAAVKKFMEEFGYDNRGFNRTRVPAFNKALYMASRKNFDRMVEEGTAIL